MAKIQINLHFYRRFCKNEDLLSSGMQYHQYAIVSSVAVSGLYGWMQAGSLLVP
jgi:hypothetical protein